MGQNPRPIAGRSVVAALLALTLVGVGVGVTRASHNFSDVPDSAFYHDFVDFLVDNGITAGCGGGRYCGEDPVTRGQMAVFLKRGFAVMDAQLATLEQDQNAALGTCPPDAVKAGPTCIDTYEASVWEVPPGNTDLIDKIRLGTATLAELQAGASQRGVASDDYGAACPDTGNGCTNLYAVSVAGVLPSGYLTWFQALAAARNAGKRLPTNQEWQAAALGTPDGAPCIVLAGGPGPTGTAGCVSDVGAFDTVGNVTEWVAEWVPRSTAPAPGWGTFSDDLMGVAGADTADGPGALNRGGRYFDLTFAGPFAVDALRPPDRREPAQGFRAAR